MLYLNDDIAGFDFAAALPLLSDQRREQALKFKHEQGRKTCAAAYLLLCEGLRKEYGITEKPIFEYGTYGKPFIKGHSEIHFNLSHCREAVVCVVSDRPVGVDVESIREFKESLVHYTMNDDEVVRITQSTSPAMEFIRLWTMKEAVLKLSGEGIRNNLKTVLTGQEQIETVVNVEKSYVYSVIFG
ncbi:MAG: 4'-phosphopantetheinyl transferase superfamily protein [Prevotella sp.]|nr:4'-phosphopantetheinyl transferase superfamily protein [Prevotella sp.]